MLIHILRILFRNPNMKKDLSGKDWAYFMKYIRQMVDDLHQSLKQSEELGLQIDESASCRLYIWLISNLFQERLFKLLKRDPNDMNEKLHKTINEIVKSFDIYGLEERDTEDEDSSEEEWSEDDEFELGNPPPKSLRGRTWTESNEWG